MPFSPSKATSPGAMPKTAPAGAKRDEIWKFARGLRTKVNKYEIELKRGAQATTQTVATLAGAVGPTYLIHRMGWEHLDEEKEIETEAVTALGTVAGGLWAVVSGFEGGELILSAALGHASSYLGHKARERGKADFAAAE